MATRIFPTLIPSFDVQLGYNLLYKRCSEAFYPATPTQEIMQAESTVVHLTPRDALVYFAFFLLIVGGFTLVPSGWLEKFTAGASSESGSG